MAMKLTGHSVFRPLEPAPHQVLTSRGTMNYHRHALYGFWWGLAPEGFRQVLACSGISRLEWHSMCPPEDIWNGHGVPHNGWCQPPAALNIHTYIAAGDKDLTLADLPTLPLVSDWVICMVVWCQDKHNTACASVLLLTFQRRAFAF